ncbi:MAG TPA: hypothetical protein VK192_03185 [Sphingomicrobium sp.]|jgi:hypothetical protein|nr:hypothetical protein [Sphingomicrobium sp.]
MMLLGKLIKHVAQAQGPFADEIAEVDPDLAVSIAKEAENHGMDSRTFVADTISRFLAHEDGESWTTIISNIQRSDDPGFAFISTVMRARLDHRCDQHG